MKFWCITALTTLVCCSVHAQYQTMPINRPSPAEAQPAQEVEGALYFNVPGEGDFPLYDRIYGLDFTYINWRWGALGWDLNIGLLEATVNEDTTNLFQAYQGNYNGSALMIPVGTSLHWRFYENNHWSVGIKGGLRYFFEDADITYKSNDDQGQHKMTVDNTLVGLVSAEGRYKLEDGWSIIASAGTQFDLITGDIYIADGPKRDNELKGFFARLGASYSF